LHEEPPTTRTAHAAPRQGRLALQSRWHPKNAYRTQAEAASAAQLAWTLSGVDLNAYRCDYCFQWHIGKRYRDD